MDQHRLTSEECLAVILHFSLLYDVPPEVIRRKIGERMAQEGAVCLEEYLYKKAGYFFE